jgi:hypothetical protein
MASTQAMAATVSCDLTYSHSIAETPMHKTITLPLVDGPGNVCVSSASTGIPDSEVVVSVGGFGKCSSKPIYGCKSDTSIGLLEIFDRTTNTYIETNYGCETTKSDNLQLLERGTNKVDVLLDCKLLP